MRFVSLFFFLAAAALAAPLPSSDIELVRVWPAWREAESFDRISEYFGGRENTGGHTVLRTHAEVRAGYYFLVRLKKHTVTPAGSRFVLAIITPAAPAPQTFTFPINGPSGGIFDLGLTGADWVDAKTHPVAWKLELVAADGQALASAQSFLWALPAP